MLREASSSGDLAAYLDGGTLIRIWAELHLPEGRPAGLGGAASGAARRYPGGLMPLGDLHRKVAAVALRAAAPHGFALAGGCALIAHGVIDRLTEDVDLFTDRERGVEAAASAVE